MLKWVVGLCAAMYIVLMTLGEPTSEELAARELRNNQQVTRTASVSTSTPEVVETANVEVEAEPVEQLVVPVSQTIESPALVSASTETTTPAAPALVETVSIEPAPAPETQQASAANVGNEIWRVTARAVNLRAGPSTNNAVVGRASRNDSAEIIEMLPSGWAKVYILETGTEAFMSAQFLAAPE